MIFGSLYLGKKPISAFCFSSDLTILDAGLPDAYQEIDQSLVFRELVILCHEQLIFNNMSVVLIFVFFIHFIGICGLFE